MGKGAVRVCGGGTGGRAAEADASVCREDRFSEWRSFVHEERAAKVMRRGPAVSAETRTGVKRFKDGEEYKKGWK